MARGLARVAADAADGRLDPRRQRRCGQGSALAAPAAGGCNGERRTLAGEQPDAQHRQPRLLIVDDNVDAADAMGTLLSLNGFTVETAHDPQSAMEQAVASDPDVVLLRHRPSRHDRLRARAPVLVPPGRVARPKLIALTGYGQPGDTEQAKAAGFAGYLVKPVDVDQLARADRIDPRCGRAAARR